MPARSVKQLPKARRNRIPLSCEPCRVRKLKCNREKPCQNCTARAEQASCKFRGHKSAADLKSETGQKNGDAIRQRIDHLEHLVSRLIAERQDAQSPSGSNVMDIPETLTPSGKTVMDGVHSVHVGAHDWHLVLEEIKELKSTLSQHDERDRSHLVDGTSLLFNQVKPVERIEILSSLPPKPEVDRLLAHFFDRQTFPISVPPILHKPTFIREYNEHWRDPSRTGLIWLGLLFSILGITMLAFHQNGEPPEYQGLSESLFHLYRMRTAQCLLSGDIAKCLPYTVETLRFNATAELNRKDDNRRGLWIMTGVIVRAAINMGYHRDPANCPAISPIQAEYRRRVWLSVASMDDVASSLGGFPPTTSALFSDTAEPRNLHDWELDELPDTATPASLPPSRPLTEPTPVTYLLIKSRLFHALTHIPTPTPTPNPEQTTPYTTILRADHTLSTIHSSFPPHIQFPPPTQTNMVVPSKTAPLSNLTLHITYHQSLLHLHRAYLALDRHNPTSPFHFSRKRCIDSAMAILDVQKYLEGRVYGMAMVRQVLALAGVVLVLELELRGKAGTESTESGVGVGVGTGVILGALEESCKRWKEAVGVGGGGGDEEGWRVYRVLVGMLEGLGVGTEKGTGSSQEVSESLGAPLENVGFSPRSTFLFEKGVEFGMDFDWAAWDNFVAEADNESGPVY